jgi:hypothetical protein
MKWTKKRPDKPGWYWFKNKHNKGSIMEIFLNEYSQLRASPGGIQSGIGVGVQMFSGDASWAGPIEKPEENTK